MLTVANGNRNNLSFYMKDTLATNVVSLKKTIGIVPFVATLLKGRFVVFFKWLFIGYIGLGDCPTGLCPAGAKNRRKPTVKNTKNRPLRCVATKRTIPKTMIDNIH